MTAMTLVCSALAGCAAAPAQTVPTAPPAALVPTATLPTQPTPTRSPPTAAPSQTSAPAPTTAPTSEPPSPTSAPQPAAYFVYPKPDGSLRRTDGPGKPPIALADPSEPGAVPPWAASPDGKTIAVVTGVGMWNRVSDAKPELALWLVGADGTNPHKIQDLLPPQGVEIIPGGDAAFNLLPALTGLQELAWSPDGALVAFVSDHENQVDLYAATPEGIVTRLTDTPALEQGPRWSPDGGKIAYRTTTGFGTGAGWGDVGLAVTARAGGEPLFVMSDRKLKSGTEAGAIPEMIWIGPDTLVAGLWDMRVGNNEVRALTVSSGATAVIFAQPYSALSWNEATGQLAIAGPSQSTIEFEKDRELTPGLYIWAPGAATTTQITGDPVEALAWSAQGGALVYSVEKVGKRPGLSLWSLGTEGDVKHVADTPAHQLLWSPDGRRFIAEATVYSRDGQKLAALTGDNVLPIGWGPQGLFYYTLAADGQTHELWLWDGEQSQKLDSGLDRTERAAAVFTRP